MTKYINHQEESNSCVWKKSDILKLQNSFAVDWYAEWKSFSSVKINLMQVLEDILLAY